MDTSLNDDLVKLVRFSIVTIERDHERLIHRGEQIVTDNLSDDAFASWMIASYLQSDEYRRSGRTIEHKEKRYLRVCHEVLCRWPKQDRKYELRQLDVLGEIRDAIRDKRHGGTPPAQPPGQTGQIGQAGQTGKPPGQTGQTGQTAQPTGQTGQATQPPGQTGQAGQTGQTGQTAQPPGQTGQTPGQPPQAKGSRGLLDYLQDTLSDQTDIAAAQADPYFQLLNYLQLSSATFDDWRQAFQRCSGPLSQGMARIFNQYRTLGHLEGPELDPAKLEEAFHNPLRFHPHLLEMFSGPALGNLRVYRPDPKDPAKPPEEVQAPPVHSVWGKLEKVGESYVQRITGSNFEFIQPDSPDLKKRLEEIKVDPTVNMFTPDLGIVSWSVFFQNHSNQMRSIGYELGESQLLWVNQLLFQNMKPVIPNQLIVSVDFEKEIDGVSRYCVYAMHLNFDFAKCQVEFAGPILKLINDPAKV